MKVNVEVKVEVNEEVNVEVMVGILIKIQGKVCIHNPVFLKGERTTHLFDNTSFNFSASLMLVPLGSSDRYPVTHHYSHHQHWICIFLQLVWLELTI